MRYPSESKIVWQFDTANFRVVCHSEDCTDDPADQFSDSEDVEMIREGNCLWFDAIVSVWFALGDSDFVHLAHDSLGCCAYKSISDFTETHWRSESNSRNTLVQISKIPMRIPGSN